MKWYKLDKASAEDFSETDGYRVLVDKLWPRGIKKEWLKYDYWAKDITPSLTLRNWFHEDIPGHWGDFVTSIKKSWKPLICCRFSDSYQTTSGDDTTLCFQGTGVQSCPNTS